MNKLNESRIGGFFLIVGTLIFLATVYFEYTIGWISVAGGPDNPINFIKHNWPALEKIWSWQMVGGLFSLLSYFLFFKAAKGLKSVFWAALAIVTLFSSVAFFLTLGSYEPALAVHETSPELFAAIRGGISSLYKNIRIGPFLLLILFCLETFDKKGLIDKKWGISSLIVFAVLLGIGLATGISVKIAGLAFFILPLILGFFALNEEKTTASTNSQ